MYGSGGARPDRAETSSESAVAKVDLQRTKQPSSSSESLWRSTQLVSARSTTSQNSGGPRRKRSLSPWWYDQTPYRAASRMPPGVLVRGLQEMLLTLLLGGGRRRREPPTYTIVPC